MERDLSFLDLDLLDLLLEGGDLSGSLTGVFSWNLEPFDADDGIVDLGHACVFLFSFHPFLFIVGKLESGQ